MVHLLVACVGASLSLTCARASNSVDCRGNRCVKHSAGDALSWELDALQIERVQPALLDLLQLRQYLFGEADHRLLIVWGREASDQVAVTDL